MTEVHNREASFTTGMERKVDALKARLDHFLQEGFERGVMNGTYLLAQNGTIITEGALGFADRNTGRQLDLDTVFELASVSKQFTAAAVMILRDRGKISLDDPVEHFFPGLPYPGRRIRHLLNHTSGLPDYVDWVAQRAGTPIPGNEIIDDFILESGLPELFAPGEKWSYCNTGYCLLASIVERVSGKPFSEFMHAEIFNPAELESTCMVHRRKNGISIENYAYGFVWENGAWVLPDETATNHYVIPLDGVEGDGTVNSTVRDLLRWDTVLKEGSVISLTSQAEMHTATYLNDGSKQLYGLGWFINDIADDRYVFHTGDWPGYHTLFSRWLDRGVTLVLLTNQSGYDACGSESLFSGAAKIAAGEEMPRLELFEDRIDQGYDKSRYALFAGEYEQGARVVTEGGRLMITIQFAGQTVTAEVFPKGNDVFMPRDLPVSIDVLLDGLSIRYSIGTTQEELKRID